MGKGIVTENNENFEGKCSTHGQPISKSGGSFEMTVKHLGGNPENPFEIFPEVKEYYAQLCNGNGSVRKVLQSI